MVWREKSKMKIAWSKWTFTIPSPSWVGPINMQNSETGQVISMINFDPKQFKEGDDPARAIKEKVKERILEALIQIQLNEWEGKTLVVEDNLDYIENEAERRGLI